MSVETTTRSWGSRVGGAFKGILIGILMIVVGCAVLFWNEGRTVKRAKALKEGASVVVDVDSATLDANNEGKLIHITGAATVAEPLTDPFFGISAEALKLERKVEIYQWSENVTTKTERGSRGSEIETTEYSYEKKWNEGLIDSSNFHDDGYDNPTTVPVESESFTASLIKVGAYTLSDSLIAKISATDAFKPKHGTSVKAESVKGTNDVDATDDDQENGELVPSEISNEYGDEFTQVETESLPSSVTTNTENAKDFIPTEDGFYKGNPTSPQIGDIRVTYQYAPSPTTVSIVSEQSGESFVPYQAATDTVELLTIGSVSSAEMFQGAQKANKLAAWLLRAIGFILIFIGFKSVFAPLTVIADIVPFAAKIVGAGTGFVAFSLSFCLSLAMIAIGWIAYRPVVGITLLVIAVVVLILPLFRGKKSSTPNPGA